MVHQVNDHEDRHHQEGEQGLRVVHRRERELPRHKHGFAQRDEMKDHAEAGGGNGDTAEEVAATG